MKSRDLLLGILVTVTWGCNFSVIEAGLVSLDPLSMTFLRFFFCAVPAVFLIPWPRGIPVRYVAAYGVLFGTGMWGVVNYAISGGFPAGLASVLLQFSAIITTLLCYVFLKEALNAVHLAGMLLSAGGLIGIVALSDESAPLAGVVLVLLAASSWAICNMIVKATRPENMVSFIVWSSVFSAASVLAATAAVKGLPSPQDVRNVTPTAMVSVLFQAYVTTIVGYMIWNNLMKKYPASRVAPLSLLVPISGIISSNLFLGEVLSAAQLCAVTLVVSGLAVFMNAARIRLMLA